MVITILNYLDFGSIFINEVVGDPMLAGVILIMILVIAGIKMGMNEKVLLWIAGIGLIMFIGIIESIFLKLAFGAIVCLILWEGYKIIRGG